MVLLSIILIILLFSIAYQDFKYLQVSLYIYLATFFIAFFINLTTNGLKELLSFTLTNFALLLIQLAVILFYIFVKDKKVSTLFKYIGLGDFVFFAVICLMLSPLNFIVFQIVSFLVILALHFFLKKVRTFNNVVPLAGYQALMSIILILLDWSISSFSRFNDAFLMTYLVK
jgi:hypothetical protein